MKIKEIFVKFRLGKLIPALLTLAAGIAVMSAPAGEYLARSVSVGVLFALSGLVGAIAFFLDAEENPVALLACVSQVSAALWMFVIVETPLYIFCVALALIAALRAGSGIYEGIKHDGGIRRIVRFVFAGIFIALCIVIPCNPFETDPLLLYTGAVMLAEAGYASAMTCISWRGEADD